MFYVDIVLTIVVVHFLNLCRLS